MRTGLPEMKGSKSQRAKFRMAHIAFSSAKKQTRQ
jgi:hypothetical protein